jgi:hypothetical protein
VFGRYQLPHHLLKETFAHFRQCGQGMRECQVLWVSPWSAPDTITEVVHPKHPAKYGGIDVDPKWLHQFWEILAREKSGVRVQVHTHPRVAFHSETDDAFPMIHTAGFLSLVIPDFAQGPIGFEQSFLAELQKEGHWQEVSVSERLVLI